MEKAPGQHRRDVADHQAVFLSPEQPGDPQGRKGEHIVAADLEQRQKVGLLQKLQHTVGKAHQHAGADAVPVADQHDEQHAQQRHGPAVGHLEGLDEGRDIGQGHRHGAVGQVPGAHTPALLPAGQGQARQQEQDHQSPAEDVSGGGEAALGIDEQLQHNELPPCRSDRGPAGGMKKAPSRAAGKALVRGDLPARRSLTAPYVGITHIRSRVGALSALSACCNKLPGPQSMNLMGSSYHVSTGFARPHSHFFRLNHHSSAPTMTALRPITAG